MKLSISNIAWAQSDDELIYEYLKNENFSGLEIAPTRIFEENPYDKLEEAEKFANNLKAKYNLEISSMQSIWYGKSQKIFESSEARTELIEYTKKAIDFASVINCKNLVFGSPKNRNRITNTEEEYKVAIEFFREIGDYAKSKNTVFAIEANPTIYNTNFINTTEDAIQIVKEINSEAVKVNFDFGTVIENKESLECLKENMNLINHIHISEPNLNLIQEREIHKELAKIILDNNYDKYVSIEMKKMDNIEDIKWAVQYLKGVFRV